MTDWVSCMHAMARMSWQLTCRCKSCARFAYCFDSDVSCADICDIPADRSHTLDQKNAGRHSTAPLLLLDSSKGVKKGGCRGGWKHLLSSRSPWPSTSAMLRVMMECTSLKSSLSFEMLRWVRVSMYSFFVLLMKVSAHAENFGFLVSMLSRCNA